MKTDSHSPAGSSISGPFAKGLADMNYLVAFSDLSIS